MTGPAADASLSAPYTVEFPFRRTVGPKIGAFLGGLRDARLFGVRTPRGVLCPPLEFDPVTGAQTGELVELEPIGSVTAWTWVPARPGDPVPYDFAWALVAIDGTVGAFFHAVDTGGEPGLMRVGARVRARWRPDRVGELRDLACFELVPVSARSERSEPRSREQKVTVSARSERSEPRSRDRGAAPSLPDPVATMASPLRMDYSYVAGAGRSVFLRGLAHRRVLARRCPGCARAYVPPPEFCSRCLVSLGDPFDLDGTGVVATFCMVNFPFPGQLYEPPYVVAQIQPHGADTRLMHLVRDVAPERVRIGMVVEPVWVDDAELDTSMTSIRYYRPVRDADA